MGRVVSVVLVTWNSAEYLPRCLEGVRGQTCRDLELIVVDNASADRSAAIAPPTIRNESNRGFSAAVNQGIAAATGDFILLLNPDCFLHPDYVERLVAALDAAGRDFGMATGRLMRGEGAAIGPTDVLDSLGMRMTRTGRHLDIGAGEPYPPERADRGAMPVPPATRPPSSLPALGMTSEVFGPSGAAAMYRTELLRDVAIDGEIFDEDFFAYREDADLAWRARLFGWRALCAADAVAWHVRRVTPERRALLSGSINMHSVKNRFLLRLKNEGAWLALRNAPFELARDAVVVAGVVLKERSSLPAFAWLWRNRRRVLRKRREIQRRRRVSDFRLARWFR